MFDFLICHTTLFILISTMIKLDIIKSTSFKLIDKSFKSTHSKKSINLKYFFTKVK